MTFAPAVFPVADRFVGVAPEAIGSPGVPVLPTFTVPLTSFSPGDGITFLEDTGWRNAMAELYGLVEGTMIGDVPLGGAVFGDTFPHAVLNVLGDYYVSAMTAPGTASTPAAAYAAGTTPISVTSGTLTLNQPYLFYTNTVTAGSIAEVVVPISGTGAGPYTLKQPLYYGHAATASSIVASTPGTSVFTHRFSLLNNGKGAGGWCATQPRTHTWTDYTGITASSGARCYSFCCMSELSITSTATALLLWDAKATTLASTVAASTPTAAPSSVAVMPSWNAPTVMLNGSAAANIAEWKLTLARKIASKFTVQGSQNPYTIGRGALGASMSLKFDPAVDESDFLYYLQNTQPSIQIVQSNGGSGGSLVKVEVDAQLGAFDTGKLSDAADLFGYDTTQKLVATTGNTLMPIGPSAGYTPVSLAITNAVPSY
jgi:hypothetical protein